MMQMTMVMNLDRSIRWIADSDGEWTFDFNSSRITHQRADNSRYYWEYDKGVQVGDQASIGSLE